MDLFDSHAHLTYSPLWEDVDQVIQRAQNAGVKYIANINTTPEELEKGLKLKQKYPFVFNVGATTPHDVEKWGKIHFNSFETYAKNHQIEAIGETGLDYYYYDASKETQKFFLAKYFNLGLETNLPIVIHCRDAFDDLFDIADKEFTNNNKWGSAVLHCFTGTPHDVKEAVKRNWMVSISGIITFKKSDALREVLKTIPLKNLLIETDSPYLAPQSKRGEINEPSYLGETLQHIAEVLALNPSDLAYTLFENTKRFYRTT